MTGPGRGSPAGRPPARLQVMKSRLTGMAAPQGFITSTKVSIPPSVEPSARFHTYSVEGVPMESWAQARLFPYTERSQITGRSLVTREATL